MTAGPSTTDSGSATVWAVIVVAVLALASVVAASSGAAMLVRHRANAAADLSALAAARRVVDGPTAACAQARRIAAANGGRLTSCVAHDAVVDTRVSVAPPAWLRWLGEAVGRARAGPVRTYRVEGG